MSNFNSPLRYPGGKNCIFKFVSSLIYENGLVGIDYAEPYAGGAGLALRLLYGEYVQNIHINDYDKSIYSFWLTIINDADKFCEWVDSVKVNMESWEYYKNIQENSLSVSHDELAKSTFFLNRTNVSGVIKGGVIGGKGQKGKYKIDARFNKDDLIKRIEKISKFRKRITVSNMDGIKFIRKLTRKNKDTFIYLDPPYYKKGADLYMNFYKDVDHKNLAKFVSRMEGTWMVSYDNQEFILNLYSEFRKMIYQLSQSASNRVGDEVLIFSDTLLFDQSQVNLKSSQTL
jgi:DNA adenine methylase